jgi:hypothetical protein
VLLDQVFAASNSNVRLCVPKTVLVNASVAGMMVAPQQALVIPQLHAPISPNVYPAI